MRVRRLLVTDTAQNLVRVFFLRDKLWVEQRHGAGIAVEPEEEPVASVDPEPVLAEPVNQLPRRRGRRHKEATE